VTCQLFADDVKLYTVIKTRTDCTSLQKGLDKVYDWSVAHQLPISIRKCSCIVLGNVDTLNTVYNIGKQPIDRVSEVRDLGIIVDSSLKFTSHINSIVAKANGRAALIRKCFVSQNPDVMVRAFKVFVRPMLEYAVSVWSPCYNYAIDKVESVQRKFTKRLRGCKNMDYSARLDRFQLQSLERRRFIADLVLTYRIIFGLIDLNMSDYFTLQSSSGYSTTTRGNPYKLFVNHCRINVRKHFLVSVLSKFGTVYRRALFVLSHYCRSEIPWVMPTWAYIRNTNRCFSILSLYLVLKLLLILCVVVFFIHVSATMWHVSGATRPLPR